MSKIIDIKGQEILDSRGNPTVQAIVILDDGTISDASVPSGASKGTEEAVELRDNDSKRYHGHGVLTAVMHIEETIAPALAGMDVSKQEDIDRKMIELDGTENKSKLGTNSILPISLAVARAAAYSSGIQLYAYIADMYGKKIDKAMPTPMFNVVNGGFHGCGQFNFQEFMIIPSQTKRYTEALQLGGELYYELKKYLKKKELIYSVGDEGGFTPNFSTNEEVLELLRTGINNSVYTYAQDVFLGLDFAASTYGEGDIFQLNKGEAGMTRENYIGYLVKIAEKYNLYSLEDALVENDWEGWQKITKELGNERMIVGDDLLVTHLARLKTAIEKKACNAIVVKVNQIGTLSETLEVIREAQRTGFKVIISHRSGETVDHFIADLAVGVGADFAKFGAPARGERVVKYNRLLEIYQELNQ